LNSFKGLLFIKMVNAGIEQLVMWSVNGKFDLHNQYTKLGILIFGHAQILE